MPIIFDGIPVKRVYIREYEVANVQSGLSAPVSDPPEGKACSILGEKVTYGGTYYECMEYEVTEVVGESGELIHNRTVITFNANGGSGSSTQTKTWGVENVASPSNPTRIHHDLRGWYTANSGGTSVAFPFLAPKSNTTYYAQWDQHRAATPSIIINDIGRNTVGLTLSNNDSVGATIYYRESATASWKTVYVNGRSLAQVQITGLSAGTNYTIYVYAVVSNKLNSSTTSRAFKTEDAPLEKSWTYIGTSGSANGWYNAGQSIGMCRSSGDLLSELGRARPPANHVVGYVIGVQHSANVFGSVQNCTTYYYEVRQ